MIVRFLNQTFSKTLSVLERALDIRSEQHRSTTANVANQDTPGYKATEVNFKEAMDDAFQSTPSAPLMTTDSEHFSGTIHLARTNRLHIPSVAQAASAPSYVVESKARSTRLDGNNVNAEMEMAKLAENNLMYNATIQIAGSKLSAIKDTLRDLR